MTSSQSMKLTGHCPGLILEHLQRLTKTSLRFNNFLATFQAEFHSPRTQARHQ